MTATATKPKTKTSPRPGPSPVPGGSYAAKLASLREKLDAAISRESAARRAVDTKSYDAAHEVTSNLAKYRDDIDFRRSGATPIDERPARERELTNAFLDAVRERGLTVTVIGNGGAVALIDPAVHAEYNQARAEARSLEKTLRAFETEHAEALDQERKAADATRIKEALASDDGDAIREVLNPAPPDGGGAFTTADLGTGIRRHPIVRG